MVEKMLYSRGSSAYVWLSWIPICHQTNHLTLSSLSSFVLNNLSWCRERSKRKRRVRIDSWRMSGSAASKAFWHAFQNRPHKSPHKMPSDWSCTWCRLKFFNTRIFHYLLLRKGGTFSLQTKPNISVFNVNIMSKTCHPQTEKMQKARPPLLESFKLFLALPQWCRMMIRCLYTVKSQVMHCKISVH